MEQRCRRSEHVGVRFVVRLLVEIAVEGKILSGDRCHMTASLFSVIDEKDTNIWPEQPENDSSRESRTLRCLFIGTPVTDLRFCE